MKKDLTNLSSLVEKIGKLWSHQRMYLTAAVLLHNMAFEADDKPESYFDKYLDILKDFTELRPNDHVLNWVYNEALMIVTEHFIMLSDNLQSDSVINFSTAPIDADNIYWPDDYAAPYKDPLYLGDDEAQDFEKFGKHKI
jgi:hypothetical protein